MSVKTLPGWDGLSDNDKNELVNSKSTFALQPDSVKSQVIAYDEIYGTEKKE